MLVFGGFSAVLAQFSLSTELQYLQIINLQDDKFLHTNNFHNAEFLADSLIELGQQDEKTAVFFVELAKSYAKVNQYDFALFSLLRQRCLFPSENVSNSSKNLFNDIAYKAGEGLESTKQLWQKSSPNALSSDYWKRMETLIELSVEVETKRLYPEIRFLMKTLEKSKNQNFEWMNNWKLLATFSMKPKNIAQIMEDLHTASSVYELSSNTRIQNKIYRKAIKYYKKEKAYMVSKELLRKYRKNSLNLFLAIDASIKSLRLALSL